MNAGILGGRLRPCHRFWVAQHGRELRQLGVSGFPVRSDRDCADQRGHQGLGRLRDASKHVPRTSWTRQRGQPAPIGVSTACCRSSWTSLMTTRTPSSPRATRLRRNLVEKAASSLTPRSRPRTSRSLSVRTAVATTIARLTTRQSSRTVRYLALSQTYGSVISPRGVWNASIRVSSTPQIGDIPLLLTPVMPRTRTRPSSFRVLTPQHVRLLDHPTERLFIAPAGCRKRRIVRAVAEFRNRQRYRPRASVPAPLPIPIPSDGPVGRPLMALRADLGAHVRLRQLLQRSDHGAQQELGLLDPVLLQQILQGGTRLSYARCVLSRGAPPPRGRPGGFLGESTSSYLHVWRVSSPPRPWSGR